jgi:hypothetical protein
VCIYISKNICFNATNLDQYIKEKDLEICALKLCSLTSCFTVICIYRSPTGDFTYFLNHLEYILNKTCKTSTDIILCGDFNINYLDDNSRKHYYLLFKLFGAQRIRETAKPLQFLELMKATFDCGGNTRQRSAGVRHRY